MQLGLCIVADSASPHSPNLSVTTNPWNPICPRSRSVRSALLAQEGAPRHALYEHMTAPAGGGGQHASANAWLHLLSTGWQRQPQRTPGCTGMQSPELPRHSAAHCPLPALQEHAPAAAWAAQAWKPGSSESRTSRSSSWASRFRMEVPFQLPSKMWPRKCCRGR